MPQVKTLQSLRFIFILMIFMGHFPLNGPAFAFGGECGVSFFFMLSGFVLALANSTKLQYGKFDYRRFIGHRLLRIYPLHILCLLIFIAFNAKRLSLDDAVPLVANTTLLQSWFPDLHIAYWGNGLSWFLSTLLAMYLLFPFLYKAINKVSVKTLYRLGAIIMAVYVLYASTLPNTLLEWGLYVFPLPRMIDFALGITTHRFYLANNLDGRYAILPTKSKNIVEIALLVMVASWALVFPTLSPRISYALIYWLFIPFVIVFFTSADRHGGIITRMLHWQPLQQLGSIAFEFYMIHQMLMSILFHHIPNDGSPTYYWMMLALCLTASTTVAWALHRWFTEPIYHRLKGA